MQYQAWLNKLMPLHCIMLLNQLDTVMFYIIEKELGFRRQFWRDKKNKN